MDVAHYDSRARRRTLLAFFLTAALVLVTGWQQDNASCHRQDVPRSVLKSFFLSDASLAETRARTNLTLAHLRPDESSVWVLRANAESRAVRQWRGFAREIQVLDCGQVLPSTK